MSAVTVVDRLMTASNGKAQATPCLQRQSAAGPCAAPGAGKARERVAGAARTVDEPTSHFAIDVSHPGPAGR